MRITRVHIQYRKISIKTDRGVVYPYGWYYFCQIEDNAEHIWSDFMGPYKTKTEAMLAGERMLRANDG